MSGHTKGPWTTEYDGSLVIGGEILAQPEWLAPSGASRAEAKANARLIAAAPELLEALRRLVAVDDAHSTLHAPDGDDVARMIEYAAAFSAARAAIAKTEKETKC